MSVKKAVGITLLAMGLLWAISIPGFATETLATDKVKEGFSAVEKNDSVTGLPMGDELKVAMGSKALKAYQTCYVMMRLAEKQLISDFDSETFRLSCFAYLTVDNTFQENHQHEADSKKTPVSSGKTKDDASVPSNKLSMGQQLNVQAYAGYLGGLDEKMVDFTKPWISPPTYRF